MRWLAGAAVLLLPALAMAAAEPVPPWADDVAGAYVGTVRNAGRIECQRTELSLRDGRLVGHYWIDDPDPFEGELTDFVPNGETSGQFTWTDRYGTGVEFLVFAGDHQSFAGAWGSDQPDPRQPVWGQRGGLASCAKAVS